MGEIEILEVKFLANFKVDLYLSNGHRIIYNLEPKLVTARFKDIEQWDSFIQGRIKRGNIIWWNENTELTLGEIMMNVISS